MAETNGPVGPKQIKAAIRRLAECERNSVRNFVSAFALDLDHLQLDAQHLQRFADKKQGTRDEDSSS